MLANPEVSVALDSLDKKPTGVFETAYLLTTPTNYDVKLSKRELSKRV